MTGSLKIGKRLRERPSFDGENMKEYRAFIGKRTLTESRLRECLDFINWTDEVKQGSTVFVKPNFTYPYAKAGITTTPELLRELIKLLSERAGRLVVGESDGGNHSFSAHDSFDGHNMPAICKENGAELVNLSELPATYIEEEIDGRRVKVQVPKLLMDEVDCFISVPVLKVHVMTTTTLSMKNLWGCYPDTMRGLHHKHLDQKLALLTKLIDPKLEIIDGTYGLDGHGPMYGTAKQLDLLLGANNPVVADALGTSVMSIPVSKVGHIMAAERLGLGTTDLSKVKLNDDWSNYKVEFTVSRTVIDSLSTLLFKSELLAKVVMDSPATPAIYAVAKHMRNPSEREVVSELDSTKGKK